MSKYFEEFLISYKNEPDLQKRVDLVWDSGEIYFDSNGEVLKEIIEMELEACKKASYLDGEIVLRLLYVQLSLSGSDLGNIVAEINFIEENIERISKNHIRAFAYMFLGISSSYQGKYAKALDCLLISRKCLKHDEFPRHFGWIEYNMAVVYSDLKDYTVSLEHFANATSIFEECGFDYGLARTETGMAAVYVQLNELEKAEELYLRALRVFEGLRMQAAMSRIYNDLGVINRKRGKLETSVSFLEQALSIRKEVNHFQGIATSLNDLSESLMELGDIEKAITHLNESVALCVRINNQFKLYKAHHLLYQAYKKLNKSEQALNHFEQYDICKEQISNTTTNNKIKEIEKRAAAEKAEQIAEIERAKKAELQQAFDIIEEKNKEILDSINYARRIQYTLLASDAVLKKFLPEHFVMFKPKDIVSGDFYWFTHNEEGNIFYLAVCDSTGHGVPGAFMSLLNITYLNEAINEKEISAPGDVLNYVREKLIKNISQDGAKDGMDAILLRFTKEENKLKMDYAAANNAPFVVAANEIVEMPCDKMPVGKGDSLNSFSTYPLHLKKGDTLYLTTDGYADQFGGEKFGVTKPGGKKLKTANFKSILLEHSASEMMDQRNALIAAFDEWKGDFEQVDDVCVLGIAF